MKAREIVRDFERAKRKISEMQNLSRHTHKIWVNESRNSQDPAKFGYFWKNKEKIKFLPDFDRMYDSEWVSYREMKRFVPSKENSFY